VRNRGVIFSSGHGGTSPLQLHDLPREDPEVVAKRLECRRLEAEYYAKQAELRDAIARAERNRNR
jgi:hypothetical protein